MEDYYSWEEANWYAIQTKPHQEDQAAFNIRRLGVDVLLPKIKQHKLTLGHNKQVIKPLFPRYLFARFSPSPHLHSIKYARGVNRVVCAGDMPVPLDEEIILSIRSRLGKDGIVDKSPSALRNGDPVVINDGPFQGLAGVFERDFSDGERAVILLKMVEYQVRVFIESWRIAPATEAKS
ncbi:MAG TPA: transcription termination/antitermination NusG family protein [Blastocatellia bacterium]|nr:transcription termination/antitermination NusG family protein [Blastocatellia bacterium]